MGAKLLGWLSPPRFDDEEKTRVAEVVNAVLMVALLGVLFFGIFTLFVRLTETRAVILALTLVMALCVVGLKMLLHRGRVRLVTMLFTSAAWIAFTIPIVLFDGLRDTAVTGYYLAVLITSLVLSIRTLVLVDVVASLSIVLIYVLERRGVLITSLVIPPSPANLVAVLFTLNGTALLAAFAVRKLAVGERRSRRERDRAQRYLDVATTVLDGIEADVYVADLTSYEVLFLNRHMRMSFGENLVGRLCYEVFRGDQEICRHCTNPQLLDADGSPAGTVTWESYNPVTERWYINQDRAIRWVDGRLARLQVATDITERRRSEEARAHTQRFLLALSQAAQAVQRARSPEAVYRAIGEQVTALGLEAFVLTVSEEATALSLVYATPPTETVSGAEAPPTSISLTPDTPLHRAIAQAQALFDQATQGVDATHEVAEEIAAEGRTPSVDPLLALTGRQRRIIAPLIVGGEVQALLVIAGPALAESDVPAVMVFANQAAIAIENARLYRETQQLAAFNERLIVSMAEGITVQDVTGRVTFANPAAAEMLGYSPEELLGLHWTDYTPADQYGAVQAADDRRMRGLADRYEVELVRKDGRRLVALVSGSPLFEDDETFIGTTAVFTDVSEQVWAQAALASSERRFRELWQAVPVCCFTFDCDGIIGDWNRACEMLYGWTARETVGESMFNLMVREENADLTRRNTAALFEGRFFEGLEFEDVRADGSPCTVLAYEYPVRDSGNRIVSAICAELDITERKQAEEQLSLLAEQVQAQARQMEQVLATVPSGVLLLDSGGYVIDANPTGREDLGVLAGADVGDRLSRLGDRDLAELLTSPPTHGLWHEIIVGDRIFESVARPVEQGVLPEHWVLVLNDVTQERRVREELSQQERLAAVGQLAAGIAHDFNNILATIVLYAKMVADAPELSARSCERLGVVSRQAWDATRLVQQILDFSRRSVLERRQLDFLALVQEQLSLLQRTLPEHIRIDLVYDHDDYTLDADPTRMRQMLVNLALNARDAMPDGGILRIELVRVREASDRPPAGDRIRLTVSDTGVGIAPEALPHIFEPFFTTKAAGEGSGLGLAQVHGIVGQHGGHVAVTSMAGNGTTFTVDLPAFSVAPVQAPSVGEVDALPRGEGETVLVVEDNPTLRAALEDLVDQLNYRVLAARNGREALATLERHPEVALVLSDLVMPEMGGQALFRAMRERGMDVPVLMLTGHPMGQELESLKAEGLVGWMMKPPDIVQLAWLLAQARRLEG